MFDLLLAGAEVVTPDGPGLWDLGISDGRIAAVAKPGSLDQVAQRTLSLSGKLVVPGGIDPHVHCNWPIHDPYSGKTIYTAGPDVVSRSAIHGGTTSLIDFVIPRAGEGLVTATDQRISDWTHNCYCDFSFHVLLQDHLSTEVLDEIPKVINAGTPSFKIFTTNVRPSVHGRKISYGSLWEVMQLTAKHNGIIAVHAEDDELVMYMYDKLISEGNVGFHNMALVHSALSEDLSFRRVIRLAQHVPGAALYMMHVSAASGVEAIHEARLRGGPVYGETLHQYALRTEENYLEPDGMKYHTYPSLKAKEDAAALWTGVVSGDIATFATDELCTSYAEKTAGNRIDNVTGGNVGAEPRMAIVYTEVVTKRALGLKKFVDVTSANAARILGLYPRKGAISVGSDADLAVFDPSAHRKITAADLHESDYTPWEGWEVSVWPVMTLLRGEVVVNGGKLEARSPGGMHVERTLAPDVCAGTALN
jgi:dihydropyrimidinase